MNELPTEMFNQLSPEIQERMIEQARIQEHAPVLRELVANNSPVEELLTEEEIMSGDYVYDNAARLRILLVGSVTRESLLKPTNNPEA